MCGEQPGQCRPSDCASAEVAAPAPGVAGMPPHVTWMRAGEKMTPREASALARWMLGAAGDARRLCDRGGVPGSELLVMC